MYVGVKTHLCNVHTLPCTSAQNTCSKVHVTLTAGCAHERPCIYACTCMHIHMGAYAPWGDWPIQRAAVYIDGPPFARPHEGRANPSGPSARGPITPCGLAAGGAVFIRVRVPNLTCTITSHNGLVDRQLPHSYDRECHIPLSVSVTAVYPSQVVPSCTPTSRTYC